MNRIYPDGSSYAWTPEMGEDGVIIRISKSTLTSTKWCAQQMFLSNIHDVEEEKHHWLITGDDVHRAIEEYYARFDTSMLSDLRKSALSGNNRSVETTLRGFLPNKEEIIAGRREENLDEPFYERDYNLNIDWMMKNEVARLMISDPEKFMPVANEVRLDVETEIEGVPVRLVGIIDRVFRDEDGGLGLMELKTGKWNPTYKVSDMKLEMSYYKMLIEMSDPDFLAKEGLTGDVTHWGWRYSAADHITYEKCSKVSERAMKVRLGKLVKMYLNEQFDMINSGGREGWKCARCDYMQYCPQFQAEVST